MESTQDPSSNRANLKNKWPMWVATCMPILVGASAALIDAKFIGAAINALDAKDAPQADILNVLILELGAVGAGTLFVAAMLALGDDDTGKFTGAAASFVALCTACWAAYMAYQVAYG